MQKKMTIIHTFGVNDEQAESIEFGNVCVCVGYVLL